MLDRIKKTFRSEDGGWKSRKLWFAVFTSLLIVTSAKIVNVTVYPECVMGLLTVLATFSGASTFTKWIGANHTVKLNQANPNQVTNDNNKQVDTPTKPPTK